MGGVIESLDWNATLAAIATVVVGALSGLGARAQAKWKARADIRAAEVALEAAKAEAAAARSAHISPDWQAFVNQMEAHYGTRLSDLDKKVDALEQDMSRLQKYLEDVKALYQSALAYIARLLRESPELADKVPVPEAIREDVFTGR